MIYRRQIIKKLGLLFITIPLVGHWVQKNRLTFKLSTLYVAGLQYGETIHTTFTPKEKLRLDRESHNAYDKYAVALYKQDKKVGYIPKVHSRIIASLLDNGVELDVEVRYFDKDKEPWDRLWVSIWQVV